jgi:hypothetical protein
MLCTCSDSGRRSSGAGDLTGNPRLPQTRRVQEHIEAAEGFGRARDHRIDRGGVAHVALQPRHPTLLGRWRPVIRRDDGSARLAQRLDRGCADTGRAAGDEDAPAVQWLRYV